MPEKISGVILIVQPGRTRASLQVLLKSIFPNLPIEQTEHIARLMRLLAVASPLLLLIDADLPDDEGWRIGADIQQKCSQHQCVLLAHHAFQMDQACMAGLEALLLEGMTAASLAEALRVYYMSFG
jgi:DNA-binding NarL/FixJ family response regulator